MRRILSFHGFFLFGLVYGNGFPTLSLQKNATQSHKLQNNQGKSMIDADALVVGRYCLPDSCHYMLYKSRDFVPGYSRYARYWLPARSPLLVPLLERLTVIRLGFEPRTRCVLVGVLIDAKKHPQTKRMLLND